MVSVTVMHEHVHQRTRREKDPRQILDDVSAVLLPKKIATDAKEADQHKAISRG
jgi:hypothetical protein